MNDQKQLVLLSYPIPSNEDYFAKKLKEVAHARNCFGAISSVALGNIEASSIIQVVLGSKYVAFLFKDGNVARLGYNFVKSEKDTITHRDDKAPSSGGSGQNGGSEATAINSLSTNPALNRSAKIRRVMMAARRPGSLGERAGVIVDRTRSLIPLSAIPEDLIAQAQVVLQGKPRDVIVRELQRTNLNVNEAVNNLLSRDDEEGEDMDEGSDAYLPEELLSLLDAGLRGDSQNSGNTAGSGGSTAEDSFYGTDFDYLIARDFARRRTEKEKKNEKSKDVPPTETISKPVMDINLQYWAKEKFIFPPGVTKFMKIASMSSELIALGDNGFFYGWSWNNDGNGSLTVHPLCIKLLSDACNDEKFIDIVACAYRASVVTSMNRVGSFMDCGTCGTKISEALFLPLNCLPDNEKYASMYVCALYALIRTQSKAYYWWGVFPFNERRKLWERMRSRSRRHVTFDVSEITEGCEVRTKSQPIYCTGSIAVNFSSGTPMVGTLMESAWTLSELCRFQVRTPSQYDEEKLNVEYPSCHSSSSLNDNRKRPFNENDESHVRETAWALNEVIFVHEEYSQDIGIVKIVDGAYCGVIFRPIGVTSEADSDQIELRKIRLMHKEDLVVVSAANKSRSPDNFQSILLKIPFPVSILSRKIHAVAVDNIGIRMLAEKRGRFHLLRVSVFGKILSDHLLPLNDSVFHGPCVPSLENYGDESIMVIRDSNGSMIPLTRDAVGGFLETLHLELPPVHKFVVGIRPLDKSSVVAQTASNSSTGSNRVVANRSAVLFAIMAPSPFSVQPSIPSLIQTVLYCDVKGVELILDTLHNECCAELTRSEILNRSDGNRTILHTAIMFASPSTNRDNADVGNLFAEINKKIIDRDVKNADGNHENEKHWRQMLRNRSDANREQLIKELIPNAPCSRIDVEEVLAGIAKSIDERITCFVDDIKDDSIMPIIVTPITDIKQRQLNATEIIRIICTHPAIAPHLMELLTTRDINGHTPFMCAVNVRAYTAAHIIWNCIERLSQGNPSDNVSLRNSDNFFHSAIFPPGSRVDDSPLFVLCANDTCSFTWTGDEHINQDIFECKTCGLVGSLCCCTECAFTCHRNHDCHLKRTSPTAYCDCWERCSCKALVAGNTAEREKLLEILIRETDLIHEINSRGEHLLLFLARTVGRQLIEQEGSQRRSNKAKTSASDQVREHDLEPPKFARTAFSKLLSDWRSVKSLLMYGTRETQNDNVISEEMFYLNRQNGTSQLDKFVFVLISKCTESHIDTLLNTLIAESNQRQWTSGERDAQVDFIIARFIRSVIRIFTLVTLLAPDYAGVSSGFMSSLSSTDSSYRRSFESGFHTFSVSNLHSLPRIGRIPASREGKAARDARRNKCNVTTVVHKCRRIFFTMIAYSISELCNAADSLIAPVRLGVVHPSTIVQLTNHSTDCLEAIELYLASEVDLSSVSIKNSDSTRIKSKRYSRGNRRSARNENYRTNNSALNSLTRITNSDNSSESNDDERAAANFDDEELYSASGDGEDSVYSVATPSEIDVGEVSAEDDNYGDNFDLLEDDARTGVEFNRDTNHGNDGGSRLYERGDEGYEMDDGSYERNDERDEGEMNENQEGDGEEDDERDDDGSESTFSESNRETEEASSNQAVHNERIDERQEDESQRRVSRSDVSNNEENSNEPHRREDLASTNQSFHRASDNSSSPTRAHVGRVVVDRSASTEEINSSNNNGSARTSGVTSGRNNSIPLSWAIRRISSNRYNRQRHQNNREDDSETYIVDVRPTLRSNANSLQNGASIEEDSHCSVTKTSQQLSMCFSILIKSIVELLPILVDFRDYSKSSYMHIPKMLELNDSVVLAIRQLVEERLASTWQWLATVLDKTEAKLRFGNALISTPAGLFISNRSSKPFSQKSSGKSTRKRGRSDSVAQNNQTSRNEFRFLPDSTSARDSNNGRDKAPDDKNDTVASRNDFINYFLSLMRSHSSENGDDLPVIEFGTLKSLIYVADAYLLFIDMLEKIDSQIAANQEITKDAATCDKQIIDMFQKDELEVESTNWTCIAAKNMFFKRSSSLLYPGITDISSRHAFEHKCSESLALAERPHLLKPGVEKEEMFGLPVRPRSFAEHEKNAREHGIENVTHQGFAEPWSHFMQLSSLVVSDGTNINQMQGRPNVIVHSKNLPCISPVREKLESPQSSSDKLPPRGFTPIRVIEQDIPNQLQKYFSRWKHALNIMTKAYHQQLLVTCGDEIGSSLLLSEMAGFSVREEQFRKKMERFRNAVSRDLVFEVERDKEKLIAQTFHQLNEQYKRRTAGTASSTPHAVGTSDGNSQSSVTRVLFGRVQSAISSAAPVFSDNSINAPPLACYKVKVTFKDEPGEGSGVARSFYTAIADAFLTMQSLPSETYVATAFGPSPDTNSSGSRLRERNAFRERSTILFGNISFPGRRRNLRSRPVLSVNSQPYFSVQQPHLNQPQNSGNTSGNSTSSNVDRLAPMPHWEPEREALGERLLVKVQAMKPLLCNKITGMILDLTAHQVVALLAREELLRSHVEEAAEMLAAAGFTTNEVRDDTMQEQVDAVKAGTAILKAASLPNLQTSPSRFASGDDLAPLFYRPSRNGYYTPIAGKNSTHRLRAFRNVGRIIGVCLFQMELFPLHVCRHVLKFILGRPINWFDLAFYDPELFESLRMLVFNDGSMQAQQVSDLGLTFSVNLPAEEGGGTIELKPGGSDIEVTHENVIEYIYLFVEARMLGSHLKCLEAIKQGVYDVVPAGALANITAEDLRLLLCGTFEITVSVMQTYTTFTDESSSKPEILQKFKDWFWSICRKMNNQEKQDLLFFWTGSKSLPPSEEAFQPLPNVLIRPADDQHLPTANTCISRLYLPLYSRKRILKTKLLMAIKTTNFGFV